MAKKAQTDEISEAKIINAIWQLKEKRTKKAICDYLGIPYNTKKLDTIISDYQAKKTRTEELKKVAKTKVFTLVEKKAIATEYLSGAAQTHIAERFYISPARVKKFLLELNVPIRARGKNTKANADHVIQDLDSKLAIGSKVFMISENTTGIVHRIYDEEYIENMRNGRPRRIEILNFVKGKFDEPQQGIHYEMYWEDDTSTLRKASSLNYFLSAIEDSIAKHGREYYLVWRDDEYSRFVPCSREQLYPIG